MAFEEFVDRAARQNPIFSFQIPYLLSSGASFIGYVRDLQFLMAAEVEGEKIMLGFLDLRKRVAVEVGDCGDVENATTAYGDEKGVPWPGMSTKYAMSIYPLECVNGVARGFVAVKINISQDQTYFNWGKVAYILLNNHLEEYLQYLNEKYRVIDAIEVVTKST